MLRTRWQQQRGPYSIPPFICRLQPLVCFLLLLCGLQVVCCTLEQDVVRLVIMTIMNENTGAEPGCLSYFYFVDYLAWGPANHSCTLWFGLMMMTTAIFSLVDSHPICFSALSAPERTEPQGGLQITRIWYFAGHYFTQDAIFPANSLRQRWYELVVFRCGTFPWGIALRCAFIA